MSCGDLRPLVVFVIDPISRISYTCPKLSLSLTATPSRLANRVSERRMRFLLLGVSVLRALQRLHFNRDSFLSHVRILSSQLWMVTMCASLLTDKRALVKHILYSKNEYFSPIFEKRTLSIDDSESSSKQRPPIQFKRLEGNASFEIL